MDEEKPEVINGEITVQLDSFLFPIFAKGGWLTQTPMTVFMKVSDQSDVKALCRFVPRVREAIIRSPNAGRTAGARKGGS